MSVISLGDFDTPLKHIYVLNANSPANTRRQFKVRALDNQSLILTR